jgi:hypothetical protein
VYKTSPIKINVTAAVEQPKDPNDTSVSVDNKYIWLLIFLMNPYVNEPITIVYCISPMGFPQRIKQASNSMILVKHRNKTTCGRGRYV